MFKDAEMMAIKIFICLCAFHLATAYDKLSPKYITEFITPFDLPVNDLRVAVANQLSRNDFKTPSFTTDNVKVSNLIYKSKYNGTDRVVDPKEQSYHHDVSYDSIDIEVAYQATVHPLLPTKKTYNGTTTLKILVNYTKTLDSETGEIELMKIVVIVDRKSFVMKYSGNPSSSDKQKLDEINNGEKQNTTILTLLQREQFSSQLVTQYFQENLPEQKISPTYDSVYQYSFKSLNVTFDMSTSSIEPFEKGIQHSMKGTVKNFNNLQTPQQLSKFDNADSYHTLFTFSFINNLMEYCLQFNKEWRNMKIDRDNYKGVIFGFRLVDLEYLFDKVVAKYAKYYLSDVRITCNPVAFGKWGVDQANDNLNLEMTWSCQGMLADASPSPLILDFNATILYLLEVRLYSDMLQVYITKTYLQDLKFRVIEDSPLLDDYLAQTYAQQIVDRLKGFTVGSSFKVKQGSQKIAIKENVGVYVG